MDAMPFRLCMDSHEGDDGECMILLWAPANAVVCRAWSSLLC